MKKELLFIKSQFNSQWEEMWINALIRNGFTVKSYWIFQDVNYLVKRIGTISSWFDSSKIGLFLNSKYQSLTNNGLINILKINKFDKIIIYNGWMELSEKTWNLMRLKSNKIISLMGDNPFLIPSLKFNLHTYINNVDLFLTADEYAKFLLNYYENKKVKLIPAGSDSNIFFPISPNESDIKKFLCEILFVGTGYGKSSWGLHRAYLLNVCSDFELKIFGTQGWKHLINIYPKLKDKIIYKNLSIRDLNAAHSCAKIVLALTNPLSVNGSHTRIFDGMASGAFVLAEHRDYLKELFPKTLLKTFKSTKDLKDKIKYFLQNEKEREDIAKSAHEYFINNYLIEDILKGLDI